MDSDWLSPAVPASQGKFLLINMDFNIDIS